MTRPGDPGPYVDDDGNVWVPRTVPWKDARGVASEAVQWDAALHYIGKENASLLGFTLDCECDERCELTDEDRDDYDPERVTVCRVPAWHFRAVER